MIDRNQKTSFFLRHRTILIVALCLICLCQAESKAPRKRQPRRPTDERVYLVHADELSYDQHGRHGGAQVLVGKVHFRHKGATLTCDSAYFYESTNSFEAMGHVHLNQGDTLTLVSDWAHYDGSDQYAKARRNVVLTHHGMKLYTDSLDYDRLYDFGYFFEGGRMVDKKSELTSDWGEYHTDTRQAVFNYDVVLKDKKMTITTDTLHYDTRTSQAHVVGPSEIKTGTSVIHTAEGYYNSNTEQAQLYGRSTLVNGEKELVGDSLFYNEQTGDSEGFNNVIYVDRANKNQMLCDRFFYNEKTGQGWGTKRAVMVDFSQKDTLWMHSDSMKIYTHDIETDSVWREVHCFRRVRAYRKDMQMVCDSLVYNSRDSLITLYKDPITWSENRQLLGEVIEIFLKDSTIHKAHIIDQALSIEEVDREEHYNQVTSSEMFAYFKNGEIDMSEAISNVQTIFFPVDEGDSTYHGLNYLETDTMRMYMKERKLSKIWTCSFESTMYPMTQIPPHRHKLPNFAWFDYIRPVDKDDIFNWRGKYGGTELKPVKRHNAPLQSLNLSAQSTAPPPEPPTPPEVQPAPTEEAVETETPLEP